VLAEMEFSLERAVLGVDLSVVVVLVLLPDDPRRRKKTLLILPLALFSQYWRPFTWFLLPAVIVLRGVPPWVQNLSLPHFAATPPPIFACRHGGLFRHCHDVDPLRFRGGSRVLFSEELQVKLPYSLSFPL